MSKTIRRKSGKPDYWVTHDIERIEGTWQWEWVKLEGKDLDKSLAKYYSDHGIGNRYYKNAPAWYKKDIERIRRAKRRQEVRRIIKQGDYEEYEFEPIKKNAGYYW